MKLLGIVLHGKDFHVGIETEVEVVLCYMEKEKIRRKPELYDGNGFPEKLYNQAIVKMENIMGPFDKKVSK